MKKIIFLFLMSLCLVPAMSESRTWTNTDGKTVEGTIVKADGKTVSLKNEKGKTFVVKLDTLSDEDREFVAEWVTENSQKTTEEAKKNLPTTFKWSRSYAKALEEAKELNVPVVVLFTGTSWCGYCIKLESAVFGKGEFKKLAAGKFTGVKFEAPSSAGPRSKEGKDLAKKFNIEGYPAVIILDKEGNELGRTGYSEAQNPEYFVNLVTSKAK